MSSPNPQPTQADPRVHPLLGDAKPDPDTLAVMRERGGTWAAYQDIDLSSSSLGHLRFLQYGPGRTLAEPPSKYPDTPSGPGWRYLLVGFVDFATGTIVPKEPQ